MRVSLPMVGLALAGGFLTTCIAGLLSRALVGPQAGLGALALLAWAAANAVAVIPLVAVALETRVRLAEVVAGPPALVLLSSPLLLLGVSPALLVLPGPVLAFSAVSLQAVLLHGDHRAVPPSAALRRWALAAMVALVAAPLLGLAIVPGTPRGAAPESVAGAPDEPGQVDPAGRP